MKRKMRLTPIVGILSVLTILILCINMSSAIYYYQNTYSLPDNHTVRNYLTVIHPKEDTIVQDRLNKFDPQSSLVLQLFDVVNLFKFVLGVPVTNGNANSSDINSFLFGYKQDAYPFQFTIKYDIYPSEWNNATNRNVIQFCSLNITTQKYYSLLDGTNSTPLVNEKSIIVTDTPIKNQEYYISLDRGDQATVYLDCYFTNSNQKSLTLPANLFVSSPTYECTLCKAYQWSKLQPDLLKAEYLQQAESQIIEYIKQIAFIIYEFIVIGFWIFLIATVLLSIGLIFLGGYWIVNYLTKHLI